MINKLYSNSKKILIKIKNYILSKNTIVLLIIFFIMILPVPYHIETSGKLTNMNNKIIIDNENKITGSFNLTYVLDLKGTVFTYLFSFINKDMDRVLNEEVKGEVNTSALLLENSISNATYVAYKTAKKEINILESKIFVAYIDSKAKTNLVVGDVINSVDGITIKSVNDYVKIVNEKDLGDKLSLIVNEKEEKYIEIGEYNKKNNTYIYIICNNKYDTTNLKFNFDKNESGSSAGLMISLTIYDKLTKKDLTKGRIIAGTGVLSINGNIEEISGIKYKLKGASKGNADIFLVPYQNYDEAKKYYKENNYKFELVPVKTFNEVVSYLINN